MQQIPLSAAIRQETGKGAVRKLRVRGQIPAVLYGGEASARPLSVALGDLQKVLRQVSGPTAFLALDLGEGQPRTALVKDLQLDHLGSKVLHVDFQEVRADQRLVVDVTVEFQGQPKGSEEGGILEISNHTVSVEGTPADIPDLLEVEVSELGLHEAVRVADLTLPPGVKVVQMQPEDMLANVVLPKLEIVEEEEELEEEEGAEVAEAAEAEGEAAKEEAPAEKGPQ